MSIESTRVIKTFKVNAEITVQAETEQEAKTAIANLLNSPRAYSPQTGGSLPPTSARVAGVGKIDIEDLTGDVEQSEEQKKQTEQQKKDEKLAEEQLKDFPKEQEPPDEVVIRNEETGESKLIKNPKKDQMMKERQNKSAKEVEEERQRNEQQERERNQQQEQQHQQGRGRPSSSQRRED